MKWLIYFCMWWPAFSLAKPTLTKAEAEQVLTQAFRHKPLYWNPFPLPYDIAQSAKDKDAVLLAGLFKYGLVTREVVMTSLPGTQGYEQQWRYQYPTRRSANAPEGFYYGRAQFKELLSISAVVREKGEDLAQARVAWQIADLQPWAKDPIFRQARTLRRSQQSATEPFELNVVLRYSARFQAWELWQPLDI